QWRTADVQANAFFPREIRRGQLARALEDRRRELLEDLRDVVRGPVAANEHAALGDVLHLAERPEVAANRSRRRLQGFVVATERPQGAAAMESEAGVLGLHRQTAIVGLDGLAEPAARAVRIADALPRLD